MTPRYGWTTFTLLLVKEQQKPQQLGVLRNLYKRSVISPHRPQHTVEDVGKSMLKRQKKSKSGSVVIFVTNGAVENVNLQTPPLTDTFVKKC